MRIDTYKKSGIYRPFGFLHATKGKHCVLKGQTSWRTVNGIFINTSRTGMVCFQFRRIL